MRQNREDLAPDRNGNGERMRVLEFDAADAMMLAHAMMIAANTAMMGGGTGTAERRLRHYRTEFLKLAHPGARHLRREEDIAEIAIAMTDADRWSIHRIKKYSSDSNFAVEVRVGNSSWGAWSVTEQQYREIVAAIEEVAPMSCMRTEVEDQVARRW